LVAYRTANRLKHGPSPILNIMDILHESKWITIRNRSLIMERMCTVTHQLHIPTVTAKP